jgi:glutathione S-transferase
MSDVVLYGPAYSAYTRIVRLVLEEKGVSYALEEVDFISSGMPAAQKERHPFGMVPAFKHNDEVLFEAGAICAYIDDVWSTPALVPADPASRAHMNGTVSVLDAYLWPDIRELTTQSLFAPLVGGWPDAAITERMSKRLKASLVIFEGKFVVAGALGGDQVTLADLHAAPMIAYLAQSVEGQILLKDLPGMSAWWAVMKERASVVATEFDLSTYPWAQRGAED